MEIEVDFYRFLIILFKHFEQIAMALQPQFWYLNSKLENIMSYCLRFENGGFMSCGFLLVFKINDMHQSLNKPSEKFSSKCFLLLNFWGILLTNAELLGNPNKNKQQPFTKLGFNSHYLSAYLLLFHRNVIYDEVINQQKF